ncbi:MAG: hypothetical protein ACD_13C00018G0010 [uncultured bacterium]|uniref:Uncharacterized protein n=1 Tax=Candidatus Woesebacteria bacterium GW2011_GWA1_40_43 TaxID=1618553 RepID=A0A0G0SNF0_9BACT|nr:MAG: hypothetical protein ACD_13C00018G0010 [uncultured bacterium]KKR51788.1 MAG: hypothetical protein UT88_C0028G0003 [Candidatus Woesebacteria bacterium GW2011_GWD2_40_19]KKR57427.1 MAG: hypothetical protein UT96_C0020G0026 [Candidatus Woesebacteria bacterium GW2011_GWC2_40_30]KKR63951.1 MAG: hypothetical protein UU02_C0015G0004 [Candidatus Woesebacteria bacterium GW2011_GWA1_40_43]HAU65130.1 hypothetical protein [Candidatus Woesebacteria bacterium]
MLKNKKVILAIAVISLLSILYIVYISLSGGGGTNRKTKIPETGASYNNLTPGISTEDDVIGQMGTAVKENRSDTITTLEYESNNPNFNNQFSMDSGILTLVKQIVSSKDDVTISSINEKYGNYKNVLYKSSSYSGFNLYIYPDKGLAYIGHQGSGIILEIWYFKPTTFNEFKTSFGQAFSENPVEGQ